MEKERYLVSASGVNWETEMQLGHLPSFVNFNWDAQFDSPYSSLVSSPAASTVINTPASSPPKLNLAAVEQRNAGEIKTHQYPMPGNSLVPFPSDPGFAERAAQNSCFGSQSLTGGGMELPYIPASSSMTENGDVKEEPTVCDQLKTEIHGRKRKAATPKVKAKDNAKAVQGDGASIKKIKESETEKLPGAAKKDQSKASPKAPPEPPKDYIHVRARRGQATDSHSLAERVRREKISERMKLLQDLVPGCNKVTGKAVMLDEIINYVQSLQRQVEFLSMKLATVNPRLDFNIETLHSKDMHHHRNSVSQNCEFSSSSAMVADVFPFALHPPSIEAFGDVSAQFAGIWEDDFQTITQMGFAQNHDLMFQSQNFNGTLPTSHMKVEL